MAALLTLVPPSSITWSSAAWPSSSLCRPLHLLSRTRTHLRASPLFPVYSKDAVVIIGSDGNKDVDEEESEDESDGGSLDLLARFLHSVFRKISRRARKAVRSVLPRTISAKLVRFSVDGVLILAFLWVLKALLEVVCTVGSMVFVSILAVRGMWSGVSYMKESRYYDTNQVDNDDDIWPGVQAAT